MIQIDGLSLPVLESQMRCRPDGHAGPRLVRSGEFRRRPMVRAAATGDPREPGGHPPRRQRRHAGLPLVREGRRRRSIVANTPDGASEIVRRRSNGHGLLADDGASIGNLVTGDAAAHATSRWRRSRRSGLPTGEAPARLRGIFVSQVNYIRLMVLTLGELAKELYQRERQRGRSIEPRIRRDPTTPSNGR